MTKRAKSASQWHIDDSIDTIISNQFSAACTQSLLDILKKNCAMKGEYAQISKENIEKYIKNFPDLKSDYYDKIFRKSADEEKVGSSRVDLQACKLEYSIVSPK